ncbi:hypothetical protein JR316_0005747 [Psilocybe cubensis]|uniref:Uncharacterized protein n=1 Tax=Psilocybe cubensis TaxID=181762 RepID=A0ACB8H174_PSICU|nr:hypothetical protein JR316_0005747 [Psilocybe cubensis]KAH9481226.1 hypothetical protein JR316_0005747 [Psilocybe cubensis]
MSKASSARLLKLALPLVKTHGFTRAALARSVLALPEGEAHTVPLSDTAVSALFGNGDTARRTLIDAWMKEGLRHMSSVSASNVSDSTNSMKRASLRDVLRARLDYNEPVLAHLPEAFALLASPKYGIPPLDPTPALKHAASVADEACYVAGDQSLQRISDAFT